MISNFIFMFRKKIFAASLLFFGFISLLVVPGPVQADGDLLGVGYGSASGLAATDVRITTARIINIALGLLGTIAVVLVIYAGFMWMTSSGNTEKVDKAKQILWASVLGLIIILSSYAITNFVIRNTYQATTRVQYQFTP